MTGAEVTAGRMAAAEMPAGDMPTVKMAAAEAVAGDLATALDVGHLPVDQQSLARNAEQLVINSIGTSEYLTNLEAYADVLEAIGFHNEARKLFHEAIRNCDEIKISLRCRRKLISSAVAQREFVAAGAYSAEAIGAMDKFSRDDQEIIDEYARIHIESGFAHYFLGRYEKLEQSLRELRNLQGLIQDPNLKVGFMHVVGLSLFMRYRWYKMPEEAFTHCEYFLGYARKSTSRPTLSLAICNAAFNHLWNEEIGLSREYFLEAVGLLQGQYFGPLLMAYNYLAHGYRMQNNVSMTEQWAHLTLEKATSSGNHCYISYANAHLAWINAKRNNWLYAEHYARLAKEDWSTPPLHFSYAFVLMDCLVRKHDFEEAGRYAYMLLHPKVKLLPESITCPLQKAASGWIKRDFAEMYISMNDAIAEARISGYY